MLELKETVDGNTHVEGDVGDVFGVFGKIDVARFDGLVVVQNLCARDIHSQGACWRQVSVLSTLDVMPRSGDAPSDSRLVNDPDLRGCELSKMSSTIDLAVNRIPASSASKPHPRLENLIPNITYDYLSSPDGIDTNLLILFHGLGKVIPTIIP